MTETYHDLLWGVRRSIRYHARRRAFFDALGAVSSGLGIIMGSAAVSSALKQLPDIYVIPLGVATFVVSAINLVLGSSRMARLHDDLTKRHIRLECEMLKQSKPSEVQLAAFCEKRLEIEQDEPPVKRVLDVLCHNELARAQRYADEYHVGLLQRLFAHFFDFFPDSIDKKAKISPPAAPPSNS